MKSNVHDRMKDLVQARGLTANSFSAFIGASSTSVYAIIRGKASPSFDMLNRIASAMPELSLHWLITGQGSMFSSTVHMTQPVVVGQEQLEQLQEEKKKLELLQEDYRAMIQVLRSLNNKDERKGAGNATRASD